MTNPVLIHVHHDHKPSKYNCPTTWVADENSSGYDPGSLQTWTERHGPCNANREDREKKHEKLSTCLTNHGCVKIPESSTKDDPSKKDTDATVKTLNMKEWFTKGKDPHEAHEVDCKWQCFDKNSINSSWCNSYVFNDNDKKCTLSSSTNMTLMSDPET